MNTLENNSLLSLKGVGPKVAEKLQRLDIHSQTDLLFHLPLRYQDRSTITPIGALRAGEEKQVCAEIQLSEIKYGKRRMLLSRIADGTGFLTLRFFHFSSAQKESLRRGARILCYGEVRLGNAGLEMIHPEYTLLKKDQEPELQDGLSPIYPTTEGVHQLTLRKIISQALTNLENGKLSFPDLFPAKLEKQFDWPSMRDSLLFIHHPDSVQAVAELSDRKHKTQERLVVEELLAHHLSLRQLRLEMQKEMSPVIQGDDLLVNPFMQELSFKLTSAQQKVLHEIYQDIVKPVPMQRLVQGDVGSGKTVVAALAILKAVESGYQAAIMAPTELLAEQHFKNFTHWFEPLGLNLVWLSGKQRASERKQSLQAIESGEGHVIVGTHALFQEAVNFQSLALIVVDEQHRFGVHQRLALREKGLTDAGYPHQLIMTATPIPRTLAMTAYADLDCSVIDELPPGRKPVETVVIPDAKRNQVVQRVEHACKEGRQVYWVCTLVEESEVLQAQAAEETATNLSVALSDIRIGLVHGRMKPEEKATVMQAFKNAELDLLVATTVIEVGVDVPNASLMIIENAERLGLAQLHQLRGRVGRGTAESVCVLMYHGALSENARARLSVMRDTNDGFEIARKDLELRGPGEVLGTRQTGLMQMRIADLQRDQDLIPKVTEIANFIVNEYPESIDPLVKRWIGSATKYVSV